MKYWLFNCNPKIWEIDEFLNSGTVNSTWKINESHKNTIRKGDLGFIRVGHDKRTKKNLNGRSSLDRGIYAIIEVVGEPNNTNDKNDPYWLIEEKKNEITWRVPIKYRINLLDNPVLIEKFRRAGEIEKVTAILKGQQTITAEVTKNDFEIILENCNHNQEELSNLKSEYKSEIGDIERLEIKYQNSAPRVKEIISKQIERGGIAKSIKKYYNFECLICKALGLPAIGFLKKNKEYYIETHHFFPVSNLQNGSLGIKNLMTLCANHHREIHYGMIESIESNENHFVIKKDGQLIKINKKSITSSEVSISTTLS
ncbi:EVE domain-containing protein [Maribacter sp. 1_MG-2023]|uniref:EVE domain-containing protein n=1 Tax=Maribacter sp. 1_MG-2023 TaxID=3062677 RepID=UPI0026E19A15|nr:EVE domain-containing protein [Maribacter sp. 1_MG-2023]MDO6473725.1 EVE domain-containing protein [Maribacter sp. 1_MG-2023]